MSDGRAYQTPLIPLRDDELTTRGQLLARLTIDLLDMKIEHAELKAQMVADERALASKIRDVAKSVRDGGTRIEGK